MSDKDLIDLGKGQIKSDMISSYASDLFKDFKPGSLIVTKNKSMCVTILQVISCYSNESGAFASIQVIDTEGSVSIYLVIFDEEGDRFILNNLKQHSEIIEIIKNNSKQN